MEDNLTNKKTIKIESVPSKFVGYPEGSTIHLSGYGVGELRLISDSIEDDIEWYNYVLNGIHTTGFPKEDITWPDFKFLGIQRKIITFEKDYIGIPFYCNECGKTSVYEAPISSIEFKDIKIPKSPINIEFSFGVMVFDIIRYRHIIESLKSEDISYTSIYARTCLSHDQSEAKRLLTYETTGDDILLLRELDKIFDYGLEKIQVKCNSSGYVEKENPHDITIAELEGKSRFDLIDFAESKNVVVTENMDNLSIINKLISVLDIGEYRVCGNVQDEDLGDGGLLIYPFHRYGELIESKITFGQIS